MLRFKLPLRWAFVLPFVIQVTGIIGLVAYWSEHSSHQAVREAVYDLMRSVQLQVGIRLDLYLKNAHETNQRHIAALQAGVIDLKNLDQLHRYLLLQHRYNQQLTAHSVGTAQGDFRVSYRVDQQDFGRRSRLQAGDLPYEAGWPAWSWRRGHLCHDKNG